MISQSDVMQKTYRAVIDYPLIAPSNPNYKFEKDNIISAINQSFTFHESPQIISREQANFDVLWSQTVATSFVLCSASPQFTDRKIPEVENRRTSLATILRRKEIASKLDQIKELVNRTIWQLASAILERIKSHRYKQRLLSTMHHLPDIPTDDSLKHYVRLYATVRRKCIYFGLAAVEFKYGKVHLSR